jgi:hypothetical protein
MPCRSLPPSRSFSPPPQAKLDALDCGKRFVDSEWHTWEDAEEGGATKPSKVL